MLRIDSKSLMPLPMMCLCGARCVCGFNVIFYRYLCLCCCEKAINNDITRNQNQNEVKRNEIATITFC